MQSADNHNEPINQSEQQDMPPSEVSRQEIFEQTFNDLMNKFGEQCEKLDIPCAIAIAKHPDFEDPMVFYRAPHIVEAATMMAQVLRQVKSEILADLNTDKTPD